MRLHWRLAIACPVLAAWVLLASGLYCQLSNHLDLFVFPYMQWFEAAPWWWYSPWILLYLVGSALVAGIAVLSVALIVLWPRRSGPAAPVYGKTEWATDRQRKTAGINATGKPF